MENNFLVYNPGQYDRKSLSDDLRKIKNNPFDGVVFSLTKPTTHQEKVSRFYPVNQMITLARELDFKVGLVLDCFENPVYWQKEFFTRPVNYQGKTSVADEFYSPVCPNNPFGIEYFQKLLLKVKRLPQVEFVLLQNLRFPFFWEAEDLDVQLQVPPYCYCPFCVTEFSSVIGEVITSTSQIIEYLPDWMEWRTGVIMSLIHDAREVLAQKTRLAVAVPPLAIIDLPFTTGQLPGAIVESGCLLTPLLYHKTKGGTTWFEDIIEQYRLEIKPQKLMPLFKFQTRTEFDQMIEIKTKNKYPVALFFSGPGWV